MDDLQNLSIEELTALVTEQNNIAAEIAALDAPTEEQLDSADEALAQVDAAQAEIDRREEAAQALADRQERLRSRFADDSAEEDVEDEPEDEIEDEPEAVEEDVEVVETEVAPVAAKATRVSRLAGKTKRPVVKKSSPITITAGADVGAFATGQTINGIEDMATALTSRLSSFSAPARREGVTERDLSFYGVAKIHNEFPEEFTVDRNDDHQAVTDLIGNEHRLDGGSLVAAGGWCAPSENLYDLCEGETLDGLVSVPEMQILRGGLNFTKGPSFSDIYTNTGFLQTEAQAEAGTPKTCYEVTCPAWSEVRMDATGVCIMVPILTEVGYPEIVQRVVRGALVAHQHRLNFNTLARMTTAAGAALTAIDFTSTAHSLWANLERIADFRRQTYKLGLDDTLEVVLPYWTKGAIRNDLAIRNGVGLDVVTDEKIMQEFRVRNLNPQFVYDWQEMDADSDAQGYPGTVNVLMYPAGTFIRGRRDVINLSAVYDNAGLTENVYTGLFFEEGFLVAERCFDATLVTIPVNGSGHTGIVNINVTGIDATP